MNGISLEELVKRRQAMSPAFRTRNRSKFPLPQIPRIQKDVEEVRRLMKRIPTAEIDDHFLCCICRSPDHLHFECPCHEKIQEGVVVGPSYDSICLGCGKIGDTCCNKGSRAVSKRCIGCRNTNHWYWERKCPPGSLRNSAPKLPSIDGMHSPVSPHDNYVEEVLEFPSDDGTLEVEEEGDISEDELNYPTNITFERIIQKEKEDRLASGEGNSQDKNDLKSKIAGRTSHRKRKKSEVQERYGLPGSEQKSRTREELLSHIRGTCHMNDVFVSVKKLEI